VKGLQPRARVRASPAPSAGAARGGTGPLPGGRGVRAPEAGWSGQARDGPAITCGGPGPPWGVRVRGGYPRAPLPSVACGGPGPQGARGGSRDHGPSCQARAVCHVTQKSRGRSRMVIRLGPGHPRRRYPCLYVPTILVFTNAQLYNSSQVYNSSSRSIG
jgi:hypothetical protein